MVKHKELHAALVCGMLLTVMLAALIMLPGASGNPAFAQGDPTPVRAFEVPEMMPVAVIEVGPEAQQVVVAPNGDVIVWGADYVVTQYDSKDGFIQTWELAGWQVDPPPLLSGMQPGTLVVSPSGDIFITITNNHQVLRLGPGGEVVGTWDLSVYAVDGVIETNGIVVGPGGEAFINITNNHQVVRLGPGGEVLDWWVPPCVLEAGDFVVSPTGEVFVTLNNNYQVIRLGPGGEVEVAWDLSAYAIEGGVIETNGIVVGPAGEVFVNINNTHHVLRLGPGGEVEVAWDLSAYAIEDGVIETNGIVVGAEGEVFITITNNHQVIRLGPG
ncbi:MAG: hypothetical protein K8S97_01340, partial [Anaerolineae bacterium]|nr:hypothetical protein [Anaerolineae bacterium]